MLTKLPGRRNNTPGEYAADNLKRQVNYSVDSMTHVCIERLNSQCSLLVAGIELNSADIDASNFRAGFSSLPPAAPCRSRIADLKQAVNRRL
jgi:F420-0:gamma-glutamyl ligase